MNDMNNNDNVDKSQAQPVIDMRDTGRRAALFKRIRLDHSLEIAEDYIELISDLIETTGEARAVDLASNLGVSKPTVNATIQRLQKDGYVDSKPYRAIFLTQKGKSWLNGLELATKLYWNFCMLLGCHQK